MNTNPRLQPSFIPATRERGLELLEDFAPMMGDIYARGRNNDLGPQERHSVSCLSPFVRHRLILEEELATKALHHHNARDAEKFVQEVVWRTYWKGWLEQRPSVWAEYRRTVRSQREEVKQNKGFNAAYEKAIQGQTGIECFDSWAQELIETNYLHNHARMWFASIWIFTLRLPWALGAEFFLHHLLDGDAASNTLSWRWVGGLHTAGKTYLARADNIEQCTGGRFSPSPKELAGVAHPLGHVDHPERLPIVTLPKIENDQKTGLLITADDCLPEAFLKNLNITTIAALPLGAFRTDNGAAPSVLNFEYDALNDALLRAQSSAACDGLLLKHPEYLQQWANKHALDQIVTMNMPVGWARDALAPVIVDLARSDIQWREVRRPWDEAFWPHATAGFFKMKKQIPAVLDRLLG